MWHVLQESLAAHACLRWATLLRQDRFSVETYKAPEPLISGLKKLSRENLSNLTPHPLYVFLRYSHPPVLARIDAIRQHHLKVDTPTTHTNSTSKKRFWLL